MFPVSFSANLSIDNAVVTEGSRNLIKRCLSTRTHRISGDDNKHQIILNCTTHIKIYCNCFRVIIIKKMQS